MHGNVHSYVMTFTNKVLTLGHNDLLVEIFHMMDVQ